MDGYKTSTSKQLFKLNIIDNVLLTKHLVAIYILFARFSTEMWVAVKD